MEKIVPITEDIVSEWEKHINLANKFEYTILDRITYVIRFWMETFGGKLDTWYFDGADEGEVGSLERHMGKDSVDSIYVICKPNPKDNDSNASVIIDKFGNEYQWESEIPIRWLFEDCEEEIRNGKILFDKHLVQKKADKAVKNSLKKKLDESLANQAKAKLTKEELKALKRIL